MAVRAKLRRSGTAPGETASAEGAPPPAAGEDAVEPASGKRTRPGLLLLAGIALLAGGTYLLVHALTAATPPPRATPARTEPGTQPPSANPDLADPAPRPKDNKDGAAG